MTRCCCICGKRLTGTAWACRACIATYGLQSPYIQWPDWVKALANVEQSERRYQAGIGSVTVSYQETCCEDTVYSNDD